MSVSSAPMTVHPSGQVVATGLPKQTVGTQSNVQGGLLNAAAAKTAASIAQQASHAKAAGVTMKGGGTVVNVPPAAEGGTVPGVSFAGNHANLIGTLNQLKAGAVYDGLIGTQPYKVGGKRRTRKQYHRRRRIPNNNPVVVAEEPAMMAGRKHRRKTKKHGRRRNSRAHRRNIRKHLRSSRRVSRRVIKR